MTSFDNLTSTQRLRATLHRDVHAICTETCHFLGLEITKPAMDLISVLVFEKLATYGTDLEAFAKHAKRTVINSEDVKLLARRNQSLKAHLNIAQQPTKPVITKEKKRKTVLPPNKPDSPILKTVEKEVDKAETRTMETDGPEVTKSKEVDEFDNMDISDIVDLTFD